MWFKLAVLVTAVAFAGQGSATNRVDVKPSNIDAKPDESNNLTVPEVPTLPLFEKMQCCYHNAVEILSHVVRKISLVAQVHGARMKVLYDVTKCFFTTDEIGLKQCGSLAFAKYTVDVDILGRSTVINKQKLTHVIQKFHVCYKNCKIST